MGQSGVADQLRVGPTLFGPGWREVESFDDLSDEEDYESDEEVCSLSFAAHTEPMLFGMPGILASLVHFWQMSSRSVLTEQEVYAILDLGPEVDHRAMAKEGTLQLIVRTHPSDGFGTLCLRTARLMVQGLETATPFLKLGNQIYHGKVTDPIGDEVILSRERSRFRFGPRVHSDAGQRRVISS